MSTTAAANYLNKNYDRNVLIFIFTATFAVLVLVTVLHAFALIGTQWYWLPASWWVGGMMVWGYGRFNSRRQGIKYKL